MRVGFIGTGAMGDPMARRLLSAGHELTVHDARPDAAAALCAEGARWAGTPRAVAQAADVVFTCVLGPNDVEAVALHPETGILAGLRPGGCYIDNTTSSPALARRLAGECGARRIGFLDAPLSGGAEGARNGTLTIMAGGEAATLAKHRPLLECFCSNVIHTGEAGTGTLAKLLLQHSVYCQLIMAAESLTLAQKSRLDPLTLLTVLEASSAAGGLFHRLAKMLLEGDSGLPWTLNKAMKDVRLVRDLTREAGAPSPLFDTVEAVMSRAVAEGWGERGFLASARALELTSSREARDA